MRYLAPSLLAVSLFMGTLAIVHCGDDEATTPASNTPAGANVAEGTYSGALIGSDFTGSVKLTIPAASTSTQALRPLGLGPVTVTGSIDATAFGGTTVAVTGTYDPATNAVTFRGTSPSGDISFQGTFANGRISGPPAQTPKGRVAIVLVKDALGVKVFCGAIAPPAAGVLGIYTVGDGAGGAFTLAAGGQDTLTGTFRSGALDIQGGGARVTGNMSGSTLGGEFTSPTGAIANYTATEGRCSSTSSSITDGGTITDSGTNPGADSGPPKTPELVVAAPGNIGHITLSNGTLYYSIAHTYFSEKVELRKVGTNGQGSAEVLAVNNPNVDGGEHRAVVAGLAVVGNTLYVAGGTDSPGGPAKLSSVPTSGGSLTTLNASAGVATLMENYNNFVADAVGLYRAECVVSSRMKGYSFAGAAGGTIDDLLLACAIATDGTNVFFGGGELTGIQRVSNAIATGQQPATTIVKADDDYKLNGFYGAIQSMTLDATHVYWASADNAGKKGGIWRRPKDGSGTTQMIAALPKLHRGQIAVDDTFLYFFMIEPGAQQQGPSTATLNRIVKTAVNGASQPIGPANPYSVVSDGSFTYYGDGANLRKVAK